MPPFAEVMSGQYCFTHVYPGGEHWKCPMYTLMGGRVAAPAGPTPISPTVLAMNMPKQATSNRSFLIVVSFGCGRLPIGRPATDAPPDACARPCPCAHRSRARRHARVE